MRLLSEKMTLKFWAILTGVAGENTWLGSGWIQFLGKTKNQYIRWTESGGEENRGKK